MNDNRKEKSEVICKFAEFYNENEYVFAVRYSGMNAEDMTNFRTALKKNAFGVKMVVAKNTLTSLASKDTKFKEICQDKLSGQVGLIFTNNPVEVAKVINSFLGNTKLEFVYFTDSKEKNELDQLKKLILLLI